MNNGKKSANKKIDKMTFEECYTELQLLVEQFEKGQMPLEESVDQFERGILLLKRCNQQLNDAEAKVDSLLRKIEPDDAIGTRSHQLDDDHSDLPDATE